MIHQFLRYVLIECDFAFEKQQQWGFFIWLGTMKILFSWLPYFDHTYYIQYVMTRNAVHLF